MSEPTLEQMIEAVRATWPTATLGEVQMQARHGDLTGEVRFIVGTRHPRDLSGLTPTSEAAWRDAYSRLPKPSLRERDVPEKLVEDVMGPKVHVGKCPYCAKPIKRQGVGFVHRKTEDARNCTNMLREQLAKPIAPHDPAEGFDHWWLGEAPVVGCTPLDKYNVARAAWIASAERKAQHGSK